MKKTVMSALCTLAGTALGAGAMGKASADKLKKARAYSDKHLALFLMMNQWVKIKQEGKNLGEYFEKHSYDKIAVYGMSYAGETLLDELKDKKIKIAYGIDQNADSIYSEVNMFFPEDDLEAVDAVVVTAISFFDEVEQKLSEKLDCPIISLEDILYEV